LWPIAIFGSVPMDFNRTVSVSPGLAVIVARLYFIWSLPVMSTIRGLACPWASDVTNNTPATTVARTRE